MGTEEEEEEEEEEELSADGSDPESENEDTHSRSYRRRSGKSSKKKSKATRRVSGQIHRSSRQSRMWGVPLNESLGHGGNRAESGGRGRWTAGEKWQERWR